MVQRVLEPPNSWKEISKLLLNRLIVPPDQAGLIQNSQCGFRVDRGTINMIFTARQLHEKCQEQNFDFYMIFVDLTTVGRAEPNLRCRQMC